MCTHPLNNRWQNLGLIHTNLTDSKSVLFKLNLEIERTMPNYSHFTSQKLIWIVCATSQNKLVGATARPCFILFILCCCRGTSQSLQVTS